MSARTSQPDPYVAANGDPFVGIQVGAISFVDEGTDAVLDLFQEKAGVNAVLLACHTFDRGTGGRQIPGHPLPDHGGQEYDHDFQGGNFARIHPQYYEKTAIRDFRAPDHGDLDIVEEVMGPAHRRQMKVYAWINENPHGPIPRLVPNFPKVLEIDVHGRRAHTPCFNHPDYKYWWLSLIEDYTKSYAFDGIAWCSERQGPLGSMLGGQGAASGITCFCEHCRALAHERGIDVERTKQGYLKLAAFLAAARRDERPIDGYFVTFWRTLLEYPEILAWEKLWTDSQHGLYGEIYGVAKAIRRDVQVGWHVMHHNSMSPFYRAEQDYQKMAPYSDFIKVVAYHNCAGPRYASFHRTLAKTIWHDVRPEATLELMYGILGVEEAPLDQLALTGWTPDYVRRETERAVANVNAAGYTTAILPGIDIDIPTGEGQARCTPEGTRDAVLAALKGGAKGVILSRKYSEMQLANLFAVKDALAAHRSSLSISRSDYSSGPIGPSAYSADNTPPSESKGPVTWVWVVEGKPAHVSGALWWANDDSAGGFMPLAGEVQAAAEWQYHWQHYFNHPPSGSDGKPVQATPYNFYRGWKRIATSPTLQFGEEQQSPDSATVANLVARAAPKQVPGTNNLGVG